MSAELIVFCGHDQLQHLADVLIGRSGTEILPRDLASFLGLGQELLLAVGADLYRT
jgi:hypothetical protein